MVKMYVTLLFRKVYIKIKYEEEKLMKKFSTLSRVLAFVLVLCLCSAFVPMMTFAEETESGNNADLWDGTAVSTELKTDTDVPI